MIDKINRSHFYNLIMKSIKGFFIKKYIRSPKREWLRYDSVFMIVGLIISVATLTIALAIFEGYETVLKDTIIGANSHIYFFDDRDGAMNEAKKERAGEFLDNKDEVVSYAPVVISQAMVTYGDRLHGCILRGIEWQKDELPVEYYRFISEGTGALHNANDAVLGFNLARKLNASLGDTIMISTPLATSVTPLGIRQNNLQLRVVGIYRSGMHEYDSNYLFVDLETAQAFTQISGYSMIEVKLSSDHIDRADYLSYLWRHELDVAYHISSWIDFNEYLFSLLEMEKWVIFIIFSFLVLVASFNVISSVSTSIMEKRRDLGILKAIGYPNSFLKNLFLQRSLILAFISIVLGIIIGMGIAVILANQTLLLLQGDVYFLDSINIRFNLFNTTVVLAVALLITFLTTLIPIKSITRLNVTEILRNN